MPHMRDVSRFGAMIQSEDWDRIEFARLDVGHEHVEALVQLYWQQDDWLKRIAVVQLLQDQKHPALKPIMLDVLRAPLDRERDLVELTMAAALGLIDDRYDTLVQFYEDRAALHAAVREVLESRGIPHGETTEDELRMLAEAGRPDAMFGLAVVCADRGESAAALRWYERAANAGDDRAMSNLAVHYEYVGDLDTALRWWRRAADTGNARAMFNVAVTLAERGDSAGAENWYRRAAEAGNDAAAGNLGVLMARRGEFGAAEPWLRRAAEAGNPNGMHNYSFLLQKLDRLAESEKWLARAREAGH